MSLLGKILAALNVLVAGVFLSLMAMDYGARQQWAYSAFRHELAIHGLPLNDADPGWRPTGRLIDQLSPGTLQAVFVNAGGNPVKTQRQEVEILKASALAAVDQATGDKQQREALAKLLLPLAKSSDERDKLRAQIDPASKQKKTVAELRDNVLAKVFDDVLQQIDSNLPRDSRRAYVADLLYNLAFDPLQRNRAQTILGLEQFVGAADRQAQLVGRMIEREREAISDEQSAFIRLYEARRPRLQQLADQLKAAEARLAEQKKLVEQHTALVNTRKAEVQTLSGEIRTAQAEADKAMAELAAVQQQLFDLQRELAAGRETNAKLETRIRTTEGGR